MKKTLLLFLFLPFLLWGKNEKPNVILIVVDDMGWTDCGYMGSDYYETPNLDQLATESMVFTNGYAGAANCAPSRAALISGMSAPHTGVYTVSPSARGNEKTRRLIPVKNTKHLDSELYTIADMFHDAGYTTATFGKWHVGLDPLLQGFDYNVGGSEWGHPKSYFAPYITPNIDAPEGEFLTERLTNEVVDFIDKKHDNPFFVYLPYYTVHTPIQANKALLPKYISKQGSNGHNNAHYATMIESMDANVGRILRKLKDSNLEKNTLVVFTSDNGGVYGITEQRPLRAGKGSYYEGGVRVPLMFKWTKKIKPGTTDIPAINLDFFPTFQDVIGAKEVPHHLDGQNLWTFLHKGEQLPERPIIYHFPIYLQGNVTSAIATHDPLFRTRPGSSIRLANWKLIKYYERNTIELFNLEDDVSEQFNVAEKHPEKVDELLSILNNWLEEKAAPLPVKMNHSYDAKQDAMLSQEALDKALSK